MFRCCLLGLTVDLVFSHKLQCHPSNNHMHLYLEVQEVAVHELSTMCQIPTQGLLKVTNAANTSEISVFVVYSQYLPIFFGHQHYTSVYMSALIALQGQEEICSLQLGGMTYTPHHHAAHCLPGKRTHMDMDKRQSSNSMMFVKNSIAMYILQLDNHVQNCARTLHGKVWKVRVFFIRLVFSSLLIRVILLCFILICIFFASELSDVIFWLRVA